MIPFPELSVHPTASEYFWYQLPFAIPGFITFFVGMALAIVGALAIPRKKERSLLVTFLLFSLSFASLGLVLGLRAVIPNENLLLIWNRWLYLGVVWLSPGAFLFTYLLTDRKYKTLLVTGLLGLSTVLFAYYDIFFNHGFTGEWFTYSFGKYPIAEFPIKLWGLVATLGYFLSWLPASIHYILKNREKFQSKKALFLGLHLCALLVICNLPSLSGYPIFPLSSFAFLPLCYLGYSIFRSDFLNLNQLLFEKQGLFRFLSGLTITSLICIAFCSAYFLNPTFHPLPYKSPYFLIPLFSATCVFALAIYLAGSSSDQKINMLASASLILAGCFTIIMVLFKLDLPLLITRRIEQLFYTAFIFTPSVHLRFIFAAMGKQKPKLLRIIDILSFFLAIVVWTPYFFAGFYEHPFGKISAGGIGLNAFGALGAITTGIFLYHWYRTRKNKRNPMADYVIFSLLFGDFLIFLNLPATLGIPLYTFGELQFLPAFLILYTISKHSVISVSGEATSIGTRMSQLILVIVPLNLGFYFLSLTKELNPLVSFIHTLFVGAPVALAFYMISFLFFRPTVVRLDKAVKLLEEEKIKTDQALLATEEAKKEIESINHLTHILNSHIDLKIIFTEISKYVKDRFGIKSLWLFLPDESRTSLHSMEIATYIPATSEAWEFAKNLVIPLTKEGGITFFVWKRQRSLYLPDIKKFSSGAYRSLIENTRARSILHVPLVVQGTSIGLITFSNLEEPMELNQSDLSSIENLCGQVAGVINRVHLFKETEKQKRDIFLLNELVKSLNEKNDLHIIMEKVHQYVSLNFGIEYYSLLLAEEGKDYMKFVDMKLPDFVQDFEKRKLFEMKIPMAGKVSAHSIVLRRKKIVYVTQGEGNFDRIFSDDDQFVVRALRLKHLIFIPMVLNGKVIGVLDLSNSEKQLHLTEEDLSRLSILGEQLAGIIYSSNLFKEVQIAKNIAESEKKKNEKLLLNILPAEIADELKEKGATEPILYENVSVMFTDFKGFTQIAETLSPQELIRDLDGCFVQFDKITERFKLEKLKTIGDSYMCAGGIPKQNKTHAIDSVLAALEIQSFMKLMKDIKADQGLPFWELRLGIHSGPLVAGVIGEKKFAYDVWGDTVNSASRMESSGTPGKINISGSTYELVKDIFDCEYRGKINAKNKGEVEMYYVLGIKQEFASETDFRMPNAKFWDYYAKLEGTFQSVA